MEGIRDQLNAGHIVLLTNMAYSAAGEPLNCNIFDVASHAAIELLADKLCFLTLDEVSDLRLPSWLTINDAEALIDRHMMGQEGLACPTVSHTCDLSSDYCTIKHATGGRWLGMGRRSCRHLIWRSCPAMYC